MKYPIAMTALLFLLGTTASVYGGQEKPAEHSEGGHSQEAKPAQEHAQPSHAQESKPAAAPHQQAAKPAAQQHTQAAHTTQTHTTTTTNRTTQTHATAQNHGGGNNGPHGRITEAHYSASFGSSHSFHVNRGDYDHHRFAYGGYNFGFVQPWPVGWGYDDDVYVVYDDGGYYMYNRVHPGLRLSINIL